MIVATRHKAPFPGQFQLLPLKVTAVIVQVNFLVFRITSLRILLDFSQAQKPSFRFARRTCYPPITIFINRFIQSWQICRILLQVSIHSRRKVPAQPYYFARQCGGLFLSLRLKNMSLVAHSHIFSLTYGSVRRSSFRSKSPHNTSWL